MTEQQTQHGGISGRNSETKRSEATQILRPKKPYFGKDFRQWVSEGEKFETSEIPSDDEIKTAEQLQVELPADNVDLIALSKAAAEGLPRSGGTRDRLREIVHATNYQFKATKAGSETADGIKATYWKLGLNGEWTVPVVELTQGKKSKGTTLVVADGGRIAAAEQIRGLLAENRRVLAFDPYYFGESKFKKRDYLWSLLIAAVGERALGIQASQTVAVAKWAGADEPVDVVALGYRSGLYTLVAAALEPDAFGSRKAPDQIETLKQAIAESWKVTQAPEFFCFGLLEEFDIPQLAKLAKGE